MQRFSWLWLRSSTGPNVLIVLTCSSFPFFREDTGRTRTAVFRALQARASPLGHGVTLNEPSPREESNLCARVRSPELSSAELRRQVGRLPAPERVSRSALPEIVGAAGAVESGRCCGSSS